MADRSTETTVTFARPFRLMGFDAEQPAGTYRLVTDEDEVPGLSFLVYAHVATMLHLPAIGVARGPRQAWTVDRADLAAALKRDVA